MRLRTIATSLLLAFLCLAGTVQAAPVAQVINLSGPLFALSGDGTRRVLSIGSPIEPGETLITEGNTYAQIRFIDQGVVTLRPASQFKIEAFEFDANAPEKDSAAFGLLKGALRTVTGLIGKRGNQDAYRMNTVTATIGIRGTSFSATLCPGPGCGELPAGTYVSVFDGAIAVGAPPPVPGVPLPPIPTPPIVLSAGQFGFAPPDGPPQQLPGDPGAGRDFSPPPTFNSSEESSRQTPAGEQPPPQGATRYDSQQAQPEGCVVR